MLVCQGIVESRLRLSSLTAPQIKGCSTAILLSTRAAKQHSTHDTHTTEHYTPIPHGYMTEQLSSALTVGCVSAGPVHPLGAGSAAACVVPPVGCWSSGVRNDHGSCTDGSQMRCLRSCTRLPTPSTMARPRNVGTLAPPAPSWPPPAPLSVPWASPSVTSSMIGGESSSPAAGGALRRPGAISSGVSRASSRRQPMASTPSAAAPAPSAAAPAPSSAAAPTIAAPAPSPAAAAAAHS
eukprot:scaffold1297_cov114-Isochrysis_galbana.AAC.6